MIRAFLLITGEDGHTHIQRGTVELGEKVDMLSIQFKEDPPHSTSEFHNAPTSQFVLSLTGVLEVKTRTGESAVIRPGEVLIAADNTGSGHDWKLVDDAPWKRAYVAFKNGVETRFRPD